MKVALIGNMNNNFFAMSRYLRDKGIDANLLLMVDEFDHFHPSADTYDLDYQNYTHQLSWSMYWRNFLELSKQQIEKDIKNYDFIIGCGSVPAFLNKINRSLDIFIPHGSDLNLAPFNFKIAIAHPRSQVRQYLIVKNQRQGIQKTHHISIFSSTPERDKIIKKLDIQDKVLKLPCPMIYTPLYNPKCISKFYNSSHWYKEFQKIRNKFDIIIFHHTRHVWKNPRDPWENKRNDILLMGLAEFIKLRKSINICLITTEYGTDVKESKKLVAKLNIEKNVFWFPKMQRKEILIGLNLADISASEFGVSWISGGVLFESLAMGLPIMQYREDHYYKELFPELYPVINVKSSKDITKALIAYANDPEKFKNMGKKARRWFQKYIINDAIDEYVRIIQQANEN